MDRRFQAPPQVVQFAEEVLMMANELEWLRTENARLREYELKYQELLRGSIQHGDEMMANTLNILLTPGVVPALQKDKTIKERLVT